nr:hypothetical protein B0A51_12155 [Rachicladosporium sp. CCFEE 5018]
MVNVKTYHLPPTPLIPNSPQPLLHYPGLLANETSDTILTKAYDLFDSNAWELQWIFRYGPTQPSHYHSHTHECMAVLTGSGVIRFGVADTGSNDSDHEEGGVTVSASAGDVFVIPAGVAHKTHEVQPITSFELISPGTGHGIPGVDPRKQLQEVKLEGFTMLGAYPRGSKGWDFAERIAPGVEMKESWEVEKPPRDPVLGVAEEGLCGTWK